MDIRNLGSTNVDRTGDAKRRPDGKRADVVLIPQPRRDEAQISASSREQAAAVEGLAERARRDDSSREALVARAAQRLQSGELDAPQVLANTASKLLDGDFLSA